MARLNDTIPINYPMVDPVLMVEFLTDDTSRLFHGCDVLLKEMFREDVPLRDCVQTLCDYLFLLRESPALIVAARRSSFGLAVVAAACRSESLYLSSRRSPEALEAQIVRAVELIYFLSVFRDSFCVADKRAIIKDLAKWNNFLKPGTGDIEDDLRTFMALTDPQNFDWRTLITLYMRAELIMPEEFRQISLLDNWRVRSFREKYPDEPLTVGFLLSMTVTLAAE